MGGRNDEGAAWQQPRSSSKNTNSPQDTPRKAITHLVAEGVSVIGGTGRQRTILIYRCAYCGSRHLAHGRGELPLVLERPAACKRGRVALHPYGSERGEVA